MSNYAGTAAHHHSVIEHEHVYVTPCGHTAVVKPVQKTGGIHEGKWICKINGPQITNRSGTKTIYSHPNEPSVKEKIAKLLHIPISQVISTGTIPAGSAAANTATANTASRSRTIVNVRAGLREALRIKRRDLAQSKDLPVCCIFDDNTLDEIVTKLPMKETELLTVDGFGLYKAQEYGDVIFGVIRREYNLGGHSSSNTESTRQSRRRAV